MKIVGKISVKTVVGNVPTQDAKAPKMNNGVMVLDKDNNPVMETVQRGIKQEIMRVFGQCDKIKLGNTAFGETVEFQGQFEATNILTGEIYRGSRLFLPPVLTEMVRNQVLAAGDVGVQFAFDIGIDSANNAHGYQYTITPLTAPAATDPLSQMKEFLLKDAPALPAIAAPAAPVGDAVTKTADPTEANSASETAVTETTTAPDGAKSSGKKK